MAGGLLRGLWLALLLSLPVRAQPSEIPIPAAVAADPRLGEQSFPRVAIPGRHSVRDLLVRAVDATRRTLRVAVYDFDLEDVLEALRRARARGVEVRIILDEGHVFPRPGKARSPSLDALVKEFFAEIRILRGTHDFGIMHNKFAVFDGELVEFGSYNWGRAAENKHWENVVFSADRDRIAAYEAYWDWMWVNGKPADRPHGPPELTPGPPADPSRVSFHGEAFPKTAFSPRGGTAERLLAAVSRARRSVDIAMFSFRSEAIADLLIARKGELRIRLVLDQGQSRGNPVVEKLKGHPEISLVLRGGRSGGVMHNKFAVFDGEMVETGAYNWSVNAELNSFENANFLTAPEDVAVFEAYFGELFSGAPGAAAR